MAGDNDFEKTETVDDAQQGSQVPDDDELGKEQVIQVRDKTAVVKDIANAVDKARKNAPQDNDNPLPSAEEVADAITSTTDKLYEVYESDGTVPTREAFAEHCPIPFVGEAVLAMRKDPFVKRPMSKKRIAAICAGCGLAVVLIIAGATLCSTPKEAPTVAASEQEETTATPVPTQEEEETYVLSIGVDAEGWDKETSSPVIIHVVNEEEGVDFYHAYDANAGLYLVVPASGDYKVSFISPINSDGSIYRVPDSTVISSTLQSNESGTDESGENPFKFDKVAAEDVTTDELDAIIEQVTEAIKKGDETLTGEAGVEIAETVKDNALANPSADSETIEESTQEAIESSESGESSAQTGNTSSNSSSNSSSSNSGSNTSSSTTTPQGSTNSGNSQNNSSSSGGNTSTPSKPQHTHNWVPVTTTVHHDAVYNTVHHDAVYNTVHHDAVVEYHAVCNGCGLDYTATGANPTTHMKEAALAGNYACGSYSTNVPVTIQAAYDEQVLVSAAWDEQVLVSAAWDETVTTGYKCSCGATK